MKTIEEFKNFYETSLHFDLNMLEKERLSTIKKYFLNILVHIAIIITLLGVGFITNKLVYGEYFNENVYNIPLIIAIVLSISTFLMMSGRNSKIKNEFKSNFKKRIIEKIVKFIHESLNYSPYDFIPVEKFMKSDIFRDKIYKYYGDDMVKGKVDKTDIEFSEIHVLSRIRSDEDKDKVKRVFDGIFFVADFHKNFNGKYYILPDFAQKRFGGIGKFFQKMNFSRGKLIELENPEFEREFVVYGSDQVEARYLLSSSMMQRILNLKQKRFPFIMMSLIDNCLFIALPFKKKLFEPSIFRSNLSYDKNEYFFTVLNDTISIVNELNLNTRIWTKE